MILSLTWYVTSASGFFCFNFDVFLILLICCWAKIVRFALCSASNPVWLASDLLQNVLRCNCALYFPVSIKVRKESNVLYFQVCFPLLIVKIMSCSAISEYVHFVQMLTTKNACAQNTILVPSPLPSQNTEHSCSFLVRWIFNRVQLHFLIRIDSMFEFSVVPNISSLV